MISSRVRLDLGTSAESRYANTVTTEDEDEDNNLEPVSQQNIIQGGRRTRGKIINYADVAEQNKDEMEDSDEDDDYQGANDNDDDQMRD
jgi:hypothetical protein